MPQHLPLLDRSLRPAALAHVLHKWLPRAPFQDGMVTLTCTTDLIASLPMFFFLLKTFLHFLNV